jgi:hypothetical protein
MNGFEKLFLVVVYHIIGFMIIGTLTDFAGAVGKASGVEFFNPCFIYRKVRVNWFGAIVLALFYNVLWPIPAVCYWLYKLCTFGRKDDV